MVCELRGEWCLVVWELIEGMVHCGVLVWELRGGIMLSGVGVNTLIEGMVLCGEGVERMRGEWLLWCVS